MLKVEAARPLALRHAAGRAALRPSARTTRRLPRARRPTARLPPCEQPDLPQAPDAPGRRAQAAHVHACPGPCARAPTSHNPQLPGIRTPP
eukprot:11445600-Alexandrium_andersonii.AAC.1